MKKSLQFLALGLLVSVLSQSVLAEDNNSNSITATNTATTTDNNATTATSTSSTDNTAKTSKVVSMSNLLQQLQKAGYIVKNVEFDKDNSKYKVEAVDRHGEKQSLDIDATIGLSADQKKVNHETSILQAVKKLEKNGAMVKSITLNADNYSATVVDKQGNETNTTVDLKTGKVTTA